MKSSIWSGSIAAVRPDGSRSWCARRSLLRLQTARCVALKPSWAHFRKYDVLTFEALNFEIQVTLYRSIQNSASASKNLPR